MKKRHRITLTVIFFMTAESLLFSQSGSPTITIEPYTKDEFPQWAKDLRRYEIVTLGSVPFVTLLTSLSYGLYLYFSNEMDSRYIPSLFPSSGGSSAMTQQEQMNIFFTSLGISAGIGLADLIILKVKEHNKNKKEILENHDGSIITIAPAAEGVSE